MEIRTITLRLVSLILGICLTLVSTRSAYAQKRPASKSTAQFEESLALYQKREFKSSRALLLKLVQQHPKNAMYWFNLGNVHFMLGEHEKATTCYEKVAKLGSPLASASNVYLAKAHNALGRTLEATRTLELVLKDSKTPPRIRQMAQNDLAQISAPRSPGSTSSPRGDEALELYQWSRYQDALSVIEQEKSPSEDLLVLKSMVLVRLDRSAEAKEILDSLRVKSTDKERIDEILSAFTREDEKKRYWVFVDISAGYDSNVYLDPDRKFEEAAAVFRLGVGAGTKLSSADIWSTDLSYFGSFDEVARRPELRVVSHSLTGLLNYDANWITIKTGPLLLAEVWAGELSLIRAGGVLRLASRLDAWVVGLDLEMAQLSSPLEGRSDLEGKTYEARAYLEYRRDGFRGRLFSELGTHRTGNRAYASGDLVPVAHGFSGLGANLGFDLTKTVSLTLTGHHRTRSYFEKAQPGEKGREDHLFSLQTKLSKAWSPEFLTFISATRANNTSTLGSSDVRDPAYESIAVFTGFSWDIR